VAALGFRKKVKITVVKKLSAEGIYGKNLPVTPKYPHLCDRFTEGQEFIVGDTGAMPEGFCPWACCTDAIRPVMFKVERLEH
jgi:uncharacterized repeat protein (TIGR04076 family)